MRWLFCTLLLGPVLVGSAPSASARRARRARPSATLVTTGPADAKELRPQTKKGDPVPPRQRPLLVGVLPPLKRERAASARRMKRSLETDPADIIPLPIDRDRFLWAASPRLRTGAYFSVYGLSGRFVRYRKYEPEIVYEKKDGVLMAEVGGAVRLNRFELSVGLPLVGQFTAEFFEKGVVDHEVTKLDIMTMSMTLKVGFDFRRGRSVWLLTPYFTLGVPTGTRDLYKTSIGGREVEHYTAGPKAVRAMPGVAVGWRWGMLSAVVSVGVISSVLTKHKLTPRDNHGDTTVTWIGAYQFAFTPVRDVVLMVGITHVHELWDDTPEEREDIFLFCPGIRFQPWAGLFGHVGGSIPLGKRSREQVSWMITLSVGWEFR